MQLFKSAAKSVWKVSKNMVVDSRSPARKVLDEIENSKEEIVSTNKLSELASISYEIEPFEEIYDLVIERAKVFKYNIEDAKKSLNMMVTINYLIKHGASGFVDEFRERIKMFKAYESLEYKHVYEVETEQKRLDELLDQIKNRANYIQTLLTDKVKLLKEK